MHFPFKIFVSNDILIFATLCVMTYIFKKCTKPFRPYESPWIPLVLTSPWSCLVLMSFVFTHRKKYWRFSYKHRFALISFCIVLHYTWTISIIYLFDGKQMIHNHLYWAYFCSKLGTHPDANNLSNLELGISIFHTKRRF